MQSLPELIEDISSDGCTDIEAIEIATDLVKMDMIRKTFVGRELDKEKIAETIQLASNLPKTEETLYSTLSTLSRRERQCYLLHTVKLMSMGKIANALGISKRTVQQYIERAKDKLQGVYQ